MSIEHIIGRQLVLVAWLLAMTGCSGDRALSQNIYEGLKTRERVLNPLDTPASDERPSYPEYEAERKRVLK